MTVERDPIIRITPEDVAAAPGTPAGLGSVRTPWAPPDPPRLRSSSSHLATVSVVLAVLGVCLAGLVVGPFAILLGTVALVVDDGHDSDGAVGRAMIGIALGFLEMVAWAVGLWIILGLPYQPADIARWWTGSS
jgi:hypothetical protein